jgi:hypothetical protein
LAFGIESQFLQQ